MSEILFGKRGEADPCVPDLKESQNSANLPGFAKPGSCPIAWCNCAGAVTVLSGGGRVDQRSGTDRLTRDHRLMGRGFQRHVAGALDGPFVVLFEQDGLLDRGKA